MAIIGRDHNVPVWVIEQTVLLSRAVGRIAVHNGQGFGTGFLISPRFVLTCHHVVPDRATAAASAIEFDYREDPTGAFRSVTRVTFDPDTMLSFPSLDCSLLGLREPAANRPSIPLAGKPDASIGEAVTLIHHPAAGPLKIGFRDGKIVSARDDVLHHTAGSMAGSAGAPLFDEQLQLIGLHHASLPRPSSSDVESVGAAAIINEAIAIEAIARVVAESNVPWISEVLEEKRPATRRTPGPAEPAPRDRAESTPEYADATVAQERTSVFISYARDDQAEGQWRDRLRTLLHPFAQKLDLWDDSRIRTGAQWKAEIEFALKRARIAILLVGPHFLASEFIAENELPPLLRDAENDAVRILPLITNECLYSRTPLSRYQTFNDPEEPLESLDRAKQNRMLRQFAEQVFDIFGGNRKD